MSSQTFLMVEGEQPAREMLPSLWLPPADWTATAAARAGSLAPEKDSLATASWLVRTQLEQLVAVRSEQLRQAATELDRSQEMTLAVLGEALKLRDAETEDHCQRVAEFSLAMARAFQFSSREAREIARGAFLHDIGKLAVPDAILRKPAALSHEEMTLMRGHSGQGYEIVKRIPFLHEAAEIVYSHHERYDGNGYPRALKGEEISLGARIFSVVDAVDAITSDRPYRKAQSWNAAKQEVMRGAGTQFDPAVVEIFLSIPDVTWERLRTRAHE